MLKERNIVKALRDMDLESVATSNHMELAMYGNKHIIVRNQLIIYIQKKKGLYKKDDEGTLVKINKSAQELNRIIDDCIYYGYISEANEGTSVIPNRPQLEVTTRGRMFISIWSGGFIEEIIKRRKRTSTLLLSNVVVGGITWVIIHFWPAIRHLWK